MFLRLQQESWFSGDYEADDSVREAAEKQQKKCFWGGCEAEIPIYGATVKQNILTVSEATVSARSCDFQAATPHPPTPAPSHPTPFF